MSRAAFVRGLVRAAKAGRVRFYVPEPSPPRVVVTLNFDGAAIERIVAKTNHRRGLR